MTAIRTPTRVGNPTKSLRVADFFAMIFGRFTERWPAQNEAPVQQRTTTPAPKEMRTISKPMVEVAAVVLAPAPTTDFQSAIRMGRSARLNSWAEQLLAGAVGVKCGSFRIEDTAPEPLFSWTTPAGEVYREYFTSLKNRPFAIVLYRDQGPDKDFELVQQSQ